MSVRYRFDDLPARPSYEQAIAAIGTLEGQITAARAEVDQAHAATRAARADRRRLLIVAAVLTLLVVIGFAT